MRIGEAIVASPIPAELWASQRYGVKNLAKCLVVSDLVCIFAL